MTLVHRVLPPEPYENLDHYIRAGGGKGLTAARAVDPEAVVAEVEASGLRGRGGAGFPTGRKWRTVLAYRSDLLPTTVVVNAAEGEPYTIKDRTILNLNPYEVLEGALIAARVVGAVEIIVATKAAFQPQVQRLRAAIAELDAAGWTDGIRMVIHQGPDEYLYGEETALLESIDGRPPFPRIAPPWRRGVDEVVLDDDDVTSGSGLSADVVMAGEGADREAPPALVDNVETLANVPKIVARGAAWFRTEGTEASPGTLVCTVRGPSGRVGVGEVLLGTPLREVLEEIGGPFRDDQVMALLNGVSNAPLLPDAFSTPLTYEDMAAAGSGLGSGSFWVIDDRTDPLAVAAGVSRFLAVESCGQCTPCKRDGIAISDRLERLCRNDVEGMRMRDMSADLDHIPTGARCNLATQHQIVVGGLLQLFPDVLQAHIDNVAEPLEPVLVTELRGIANNREVLDETFRRKQVDWTHGDVDPGRSPFERLVERRAHESLD
jgi:NADH:ubiquinone oxidoreductase subunit F (NADH-binding)